MNYVEDLSMVLRIICATVVGEIFARAFCRNMDARDDSCLDSIAKVKCLLSGAKIPHVLKFPKRNPQRYLCVTDSFLLGDFVRMIVK